MIKVFISLFLFIFLSFGLQYKVNRLIILTLNLTPDLSKVLLDEYRLLSNLGFVCEAYINEQIQQCLNTYKAREVWYVYIGHSFNGSLGNFLNEQKLYFSKKIDYIFLDGCKTYTSFVKDLNKYTRKGIYAWKTNAPALGMIYLFYYHLWDNPQKAIDFYKQQFHRRYRLIFLPSMH